jgi:hypothetical protein
VFRYENSFTRVSEIKRLRKNYGENVENNIFTTIRKWQNSLKTSISYDR